MLESLSYNGHYGDKSTSDLFSLDTATLKRESVSSEQKLAQAELSDEALMAAYATGNMAAFEQLYHRHKAPLLRYFIRQVSNRATAEELFQETWQSLIRNSSNYKSSAKFSTYLYHIGHSRLVDFYRKNGRENWLSYSDDEQSFEPVAEAEQEPERLLDLEQLEQHLLEALEKLVPAQKEVFILKYEAGLTMPEIAETLKLNLEAVKSRLRYAVANLQGHLPKNKINKG